MDEVKIFKIQKGICEDNEKVAEATREELKKHF